MRVAETNQTPNFTPEVLTTVLLSKLSFKSAKTTVARASEKISGFQKAHLSQEKILHLKSAYL